MRARLCFVSIVTLVVVTVAGCKPLKKHFRRGRHAVRAVAAASSTSVLSDVTDDSPKLVAPETALDKARRLVAAGKYDEAMEACNSALDKDHFDARLLGMQARVLAQYKKSEPVERVLGAFWLAASGSGDDHVKAEIWLNRAHYAKTHGDDESWRASLARSLSIEQNPTVAAELGSRSRCLAELRVPNGGSATVATGWLGVCRAVQKCAGKEHVDEATARARSCLSHPGSAGIDTSHGCNEEPPWLSTHDYNMYHWTEDLIVPLPGNRYFVYSTGAGEWPAHCDASIDEHRDVIGGFLQIRSEVVEHEVPPRSNLDGNCWDADTQVSHEYYSTSTGQRLLLMSWLKDDGIVAHFDERKREVALTGGGCDGTVALDGHATFRGTKP